MCIWDICDKLFCGEYAIRRHVNNLLAKGTVKKWRIANEVFYSVLAEHRIIDENVAGPRTFEFKPLTGYDMTAGMRLAEGARNSERGMV